MTRSGRDGGSCGPTEESTLGRVPGPADMPVSRSGVLFSLVVTFYNQREFVRAALDSALAQQRDTLEIIAVDDGSTDGTQDVLGEYGDAIRIVLLDENQGVSAARNRGVAEATGMYLLFLDGDDTLPPWAIDVYETLANAKRPVIMMGRYFWFEGELPEPADFPPEIRFVEYGDYFEKDRSVGARAGAMAVARWAFDEVGGWTREIAAGEDCDLVWRLGVVGPVIYIIEPTTTFHRSHADQTIRRTSLMFESMMNLIRNEKEGRYPGGRKRSFERRACVGGAAFNWALAIRHGSHAHAARLLTRSWAYVLAAVVLRLRVRVRGLRPTQALALSTAGSQPNARQAASANASDSS